MTAAARAGRKPRPTASGAGKVTTYWRQRGKVGDDWFSVSLTADGVASLAIDTVAPIPPGTKLLDADGELLTFLGSPPKLKAGPAPTDYIVQLVPVMPMPHYTVRLAGPGPDLSIEDSTVDGLIAGGNTVWVQATVANHCTGGTDAAVMEACLVSADPADSVLLGPLAPESAVVASAQKVTYGGELTLPAAVPPGAQLEVRLVGTDTLYLRADDIRVATPAP